MARVELEPHRAAFPPGYVERSVIYRVSEIVSHRSRRMRAFFFGLPYTRARMFFVARYFAQILTDVQKQDLDRFLPAIHPDARLDFFGVETFHGPDGWGAAMRDWIATFQGAAFEMHEFLDPGSGEVLLVSVFAGHVGDSDADVQQEAALLLRIERGMSVHGRVFTSRAEAVAAMRA